MSFFVEKVVQEPSQQREHRALVAVLSHYQSRRPSHLSFARFHVSLFFLPVIFFSTSQYVFRASAAVAAHSDGVRLDAMPSTCAFRPPSPPTSTSRSRSSSIGSSSMGVYSSRVAWKASPQPESSQRSPAAGHVPFHHQEQAENSPDEPVPVPHREVPRPIPATHATKSRAAAASLPSRPATHGVASGAATGGGVIGYMPPKLSTLAPKLKGSAAAAGSGGRPSTTHAATSTVVKEAKAAKPYNATGLNALCSLALRAPFSNSISDNAKYVRNAVCDRLLAGPVLQREREDVLHRLSQGDYVQWVVLLTRDMPFKVRTNVSIWSQFPVAHVDCSCAVSMAFRRMGCWHLPWASAPRSLRPQCRRSSSSAIVAVDAVCCVLALPLALAVLFAH
jgi:hypothetical protein